MTIIAIVSTIAIIDKAINAILNKLLRSILFLPKLTFVKMNAGC
jgi:hypothetical protein